MHADIASVFDPQAAYVAYALAAVVLVVSVYLFTRGNLFVRVGLIWFVVSALPALPLDKYLLHHIYVPLIGMALVCTACFSFIAGRMRISLPAHLRTEELEGAGIVGLLLAVDGFDPNHGVDFSTYAQPRIRGAILDELRKLDPLPRSARQKAKGIARALAALEQQLGRQPEHEEVAGHLGLSLEAYYEMLGEGNGFGLHSCDDGRTARAEDEPDSFPNPIGDPSRDGVPRDLLARERQALLDRMPVGIFRTTPDGRLVDANPALVELLHYPDRESLLGTNAKIVTEVTENIVANSPDCVIIVVADTLDEMTYLAAVVSGFPKERGMGMAGVLDSARLRFFNAEKLNVSPQEVEVNAKTYLDQVGRILRPERLEVVRNSAWLKPLTFYDLVGLAARMTVARFLERDDFTKRHKEGTPIFLHEFLYLVMQAYDSVVVKADVELGGTDQTFNLLVGRDLMRDLGMEPQVALTCPILPGIHGGAKMSKSLGNYVGVTEPPFEMYSKLMSIPDALMKEYYTLLTPVPEDEVDTMCDAKKTHPKAAKERLGRTIVSEYHGEAAAGSAMAEWRKKFSDKAVPDQVPEVDLAGLVSAGKVSVAKVVAAARKCSASEARRLIEQRRAEFQIDHEAIGRLGYRLDWRGFPPVGPGQRLLFLEPFPATVRLASPVAAMLAIDWVAPRTVPVRWVTIAVSALAAGAFVDLISLPGEERVHIDRLFEWIGAGGFTLDATVRVDPLSMTMTLVVTGVGALIHWYAIGYMEQDPRVGRFFAYLNLFVFFMLVLVLGANFPLLFVGWEGVGLCSYLLIGFWFNEKINADAGKKAFIVNRIGDFGFLAAMLLLWRHLGALDFTTVFERAPALAVGGPIVTAITLFLFLGCTGKSAQIPLFTWLPDAMQGPTPVSALIHAATMVTAGVYLVARTNVLFAMAPVSSAVVAGVGALTALFAATIALKQWDIKRVLAYSTVSQLGYMFVGVGTGAYAAGMFHLTTHAFFKALLFLGSGSVIHAMHQALHAAHTHEDPQDMRNMGGLRHRMPWTYALMGIATVAIAGIPPLSGFFSKDEILAAAFARGTEVPLWRVYWAMALVAALLTAFYMTRLMLYTFHGPNRTGAGAEPHLHEAPRVMTVPLVVLALLTVLGGALNLPGWFFGGSQWLHHWLAPVTAGAAGFLPELHLDHDTERLPLMLAVVIAVAGIGAAVRLLRPQDLVAARLAPAETGLGRLL